MLNIKIIALAVDIDDKTNILTFSLDLFFREYYLK